jgi:hypothetical protein
MKKVFIKNIHLVGLSLYVVCKNINSIAKMLIGCCDMCVQWVLPVRRDVCGQAIRGHQAGMGH